MIIDVNDLVKNFYQHKVFFKGKLLTRALNDVSFRVREGDFFGLLGRNGAGKSTLLRILTTNLKKTDGEVIVNGYDIEKDVKNVKEEISWMFGLDYDGFGWSSIQKNLMLAAHFMGLDKGKGEKRVKELLEYFDLYRYRKLDVWRMSTGMRGRYCLAIAMLKDPKILFLDEPLLGLDIPSKDILRDYLKKINKEGTTIVYTDQQLHEMEKVCNNVVIIEKGDKVYDGSIDELKEHYRDSNVLDITCISNNVNQVLSKLENEYSFITDYEINESVNGIHKIKIYTSIDSKKALLTVGGFLKKQGVIVERLNAGLLSLEDVFKKFLNKDKHNQKASRLKNYRVANETPPRSEIRYLQHEYHKVRGEACGAFYKHDKKLVAGVLGKMLSLTKEMRIEASKIIGDLREKQLIKGLANALRSSDKDIKLHVAIALAKNGHRNVTPYLVDLLLDGERCETVLENLKNVDKNVLSDLSYQLTKLNIFDRSFLLYHINKLKDKEEILDLLQIKNWVLSRRGRNRGLHKVMLKVRR